MSEKADRALLEDVKRATEGLPVTPWSAQVQELCRDGLIEIRAVLTPKGERWLGAVKRGGKV